MRIEATVPSSRGVALRDLSAELGVSKSQLIDEALAVFLKIVMEARKGRQLISVGAEGEVPCEIASPTLTQMEWMRSRQTLTLSATAVERMADELDSPSPPTPALRAALEVARSR